MALKSQPDTASVSGAPRTDLPSVSVVVPVYNSAGTLQPLVKRLDEVLPKCTSRYELILVNDGSGDGSWQRIEQLATGRDNLFGINLMRNYGQHNALLAGVRRARYPVTITIDDDLQNPPEHIPALLAALNDADVVYATPGTAGHGLARRLASRITKGVLQGAMGADTATKISAYRAFRTSLRDGFVDASGPTINIDVLLTWSTTRFAAIPVTFDERAEGASNYTARQLMRHALNMLTGFSTVPLRLASLIGFVFTALGGVILIYVLVRFLQTRGAVPGFAFLAAIICIFAGVQLFTIGVIGEYLARMYHRMLAKPSYVIRSTAGSPTDRQE